jgi:hypothetical protein
MTISISTMSNIRMSDIEIKNCICSTFSIERKDKTYDMIYLTNWTMTLMGLMKELSLFLLDFNFRPGH